MCCLRDILSTDAVNFLGTSSLRYNDSVILIVILTLEI